MRSDSTGRLWCRKREGCSLQTLHAYDTEKFSFNYIPVQSIVRGEIQPARCSFSHASLGDTTKTALRTAAGKCRRLPVTSVRSAVAIATSRNGKSSGSGSGGPVQERAARGSWIVRSNRNASRRSRERAKRGRASTSRYSASMRSSFPGKSRPEKGATRDKQHADFKRVAMGKRSGVVGHFGVSVGAGAAVACADELPDAAGGNRGLVAGGWECE